MTATPAAPPAPVTRITAPLLHSAPPRSSRADRVGPARAAHVGQPRERGSETLDRNALPFERRGRPRAQIGDARDRGRLPLPAPDRERDVREHVGVGLGLHEAEQGRRGAVEPEPDQVLGRDRAQLGLRFGQLGHELDDPMRLAADAPDQTELEHGDAQEEQGESDRDVIGQVRPPATACCWATRRRRRT